MRDGVFGKMKVCLNILLDHTAVYYIDNVMLYHSRSLLTNEELRGVFKS